MMTYILQVTLLSALLLLPYMLLYRNETFFRFNRTYLLAAVAISILGPAIPDFIYINESLLPVSQLPVVAITSDLAVATLPEVTTGENGVSVMVVLGWLYLAVLIAGMLRILFELSGLYMLYRRSDKESLHGYQIVVGRYIDTPFSFFGAVFLPESVRRDPGVCDHVLRHELRHVRLGHSWDSLFMAIVCAVFWINPFFYLYKHALKAVHEFQADGCVPEDEIVNYSQLLIAQSQSGLRLSLTNQFFQSQLKSRIMMMMKQRSNEASKWKYLLALPLVALAITLFAFKTPTTNTTPEQADPLALTIADENEFPKFPGCETESCSNSKLVKYVGENLKYPTSAKDAGIEGTVIVQFTVSAEGKITESRVARGIDATCDAEALRVVRSINEVGTWTPGNEDGKPVAVELTLPISFQIPQQDPRVPQDVFQVAEEMPRFPGCEDMADKVERKTCSWRRLVEYIAENLQYPAEAKKKKIEGRVIAQFIVETDGSISTIKIVRNIHPACDAEVVRILESMNDMEENWTPGRQDGKAVRTQFTLPVQFKL